MPLKFCAAQLTFGLVKLEYRYCISIELEGGVGVTLFFLLHTLSSYVMVRLHTENQLAWKCLKSLCGGWVLGGAT
jgi:hypothetical protein